MTKPKKKTTDKYRDLGTLLRRLGKLTTSKIVDRLVAAGVSGECSDIEDCPLAVYLRRQLKVRHLTVGLYEVHLKAAGGVTGSYPMPRSVSALAKQFDKGKWFELTGEGADVWAWMSANLPKKKSKKK
jgi:hypothetical protein